MANITAARTCLVMDGLAMASLPAVALQSTSWYRGGAVGVIRSGTNAGYATNTFDGTVDALFLGIMKRTIVVPASTDVDFTRKRQLPVKRDGAVTFNAVTTAGVAATPDATWRYKRVYLVTDNEVSLTPTTGFATPCGRVIGINGDLGFGQIASTEVIVEMQDAAQGPVASEGLRVNVSTLAASGTTQANAIANAPITARFTQVTGANNANGIALPVALPGDIYIVKVSTAGSTVLVYGQLNEGINAGTANSAYNTAQVGSVAFIKYNTSTWYSLPLAG